MAMTTDCTIWVLPCNLCCTWHFFSCLNKTCFTKEFSHSNNRAWPSIIDFILTIFHWSLSTCTQELRPQTSSEIIRKPETDATNDLVVAPSPKRKNKNNFTAWRVVYRNLHWSWRHILSIQTPLPDLIGNFLDCLPYILRIICYWINK